MKLFSLLLYLLILFPSIIFSAAPFWKIINEQDGMKIEIDIANIKKINKNIIRVWSRSYLNLDNLGNVHSKQFNEIDCSNKRIIELQATIREGWISDQGEVLQNILEPHDWGYAAPGSVQEVLVDESCV